MKAARNLADRLSANMMESMGAVAPDGPGPPSGGVLHGGAAKYQGAARIKDALAIKLDQITPDPDQPRKEFDPEELANLAESLKARGQLQPIRVRWDDASGKWVIIAGERRFRAAQIAGLPSLACIEATRPQTADDILEDQLVENCLRADLKPVEQARAFRDLMDRRGWSYRQLGSTLNLSSSHITRCMALLTLPDDLQAEVDAGTIPASAAAEVAKMGDDDARREIVAKIISGEMTRDETVAEVRKASGKAKGRGAKGRLRKTSASFRAANGCKITAEHRRGLDDELIRSALLDALAQLDSRSEAA